MVHFRKSPLFYYYPLFSIASLLLLRMFESNYPTREPQLFNEFLYINIWTPLFYVFLFAYLIPLFLSIDLKKNVSYLLKITFVVLFIIYTAISAYYFFMKKKPDLLPPHFDRLVGIIGGILLGLASTRPKE